jgi:hypothetical protein
MDHTRKNAPRFLGETASQHIVRLERANHHGTREGMRERERERERQRVCERERDGDGDGDGDGGKGERE